MKKKLLLALLTVSALGMTAVNADNFTQSADIEIVEGLNLVETQRMNLGVIERPVSSFVKLYQNRDGTLSSGDTANYVDTTNIAPGKYTITGSANKTISISGTSDNNINGIYFTNLFGYYDGAVSGETISIRPMTNAPPPGSGKELVLLGVTYVYPSVAEGQYQPQFTLSVNYE